MFTLESYRNTSSMFGKEQVKRIYTRFSVTIAKHGEGSVMVRACFGTTELLHRFLPVKYESFSEIKAEA